MNLYPNPYRAPRSATRQALWLLVAGPAMTGCAALSMLWHLRVAAYHKRRFPNGPVERLTEQQLAHYGRYVRAMDAVSRICTQHAMANGNTFVGDRRWHAWDKGPWWRAGEAQEREWHRAYWADRRVRPTQPARR